MTLVGGLKRAYRKYFYQTLKRSERHLRRLVFAIFEFIYPRFNAFRVFGVPRRVQSLPLTEVIPPVAITRQPPLTRESSVPPRFTALEATISGEGWSRISEGIVTSTAAVLNGRGELIPQLTQQFTQPDPEKHKLFTFRRNRCFARIPRFEGVVASLAIDCYWNYYHWLFDGLAKLAILERTGITPDYYYAPTRCRFHLDSLALMGIPEEKILPMEQYPTLCAQELIATSFPAMSSPAPWVSDFLRQKLAPKKQAGSRRLFLSRKAAPCRRIVNEEALERLLMKEGFECIEPGHLTLTEQIALFGQASIIVAPHGAGLSNLLFCPSETRVLEMLTPRYLAPHYWILSNLLGLRYAFLVGEEKPELHCPEPANDPLYVCPEKLTETLKLFV